jgi:hypothetical protein
VVVAVAGHHDESKLPLYLVRRVRKVGVEELWSSENDVLVSYFQSAPASTSSFRKEKREEPKHRLIVSSSALHVGERELGRNMKGRNKKEWVVFSSQPPNGLKTV